MATYADYDFYKLEYKGELEKNEFDSLNVQASQYIRYVTVGRSEYYQGEELQYAACAVIDIYAGFDRNNGRVVQSENTDGYSVSYAIEGVDGELTEQVRDRKAYQELKRWLSGTGLLSRKVGCRHDHQCRSYNF